MRSECGDAADVPRGLDEALGHELTTAAERDARVVVFLVGLLGDVRVSYLALKERAVLGLLGAGAVPKRLMGVRVDVHLNDARLNRVPDVLHRRTTAAVEHKPDRLGAFLQPELLIDVI